MPECRAVSPCRVASSDEPQALVFLSSFFSNPKFGKEKESKLRGRKFTFIEIYVTHPPPGPVERAAPPPSFTAALGGGYHKGQLLYEETESRMSFTTRIRSHKGVFPGSPPAPRTRWSTMWLTKAKEGTPCNNRNHKSPQQQSQTIKYWLGNATRIWLQTSLVRSRSCCLFICFFDFILCKNEKFTTTTYIFHPQICWPWTWSVGYSLLTL